MRWNRSRSSNNVVRASGGGRRFSLGGRGPRLGIGGLIVVGILSLVFHQNFFSMLGLMGPGGTSMGPQQTTNVDTSNDPQVQFVKHILGSTEDVWARVLKAHGIDYPEPTLVLFRGHVNTACGSASSAVGPFYCPGDQRVYLDLGFFDTMKNQLQASTADFARAYVIAHEVGHHVQNVLGISGKVAQARRQGGAQMEGPTGLSVRQELQADCFAGVWAAKSQQQLDWLQAGDVAAAVDAAQAIGDDTLQRRARGTVMPDTFTHGTSAQRVRWFKTGLQSGNPASCNTFKATRL